MDFKLHKPLKIDGKEVKELKYDFDELPSNAISRATTFLTKAKIPVANPVVDIELNALLFGIACGLHENDAFRMHPKDKLRGAALSMNFFHYDSEDSLESNTSEG